MVKKWTCDGKPKNKRFKGKGKPHPPCDNFGERCKECNLPREAMNQGNSANIGQIILIILGLSLVGVGITLGAQFLPDRSLTPPPPPSPSPPITSNPFSCSFFQPQQEKERFSSGQRELFSQSTPNTDLERGIENFKTGAYEQAWGRIDLNDGKTEIPGSFANAMKADPNNPEPKIYYNNAKARAIGCPYQVAVVVPIENRADVAKEILRGVADAQDKFNRTQIDNKKTRLMEVVIVDDGNDARKASKQVAQEIANNPAILGVIGHNSSSASKAALPFYENAGIAMISPTSTSTDLQGDVFFRTVPSDAEIAPVMVDYLQKKNAKNILVFYEKGNNYSESLLQAVENKLQPIEIEDKVNISLPLADIRTKIAQFLAQENKPIDTVILLPSTETTIRATSLVQILREQEEENGKSQKINILGGDVLYNPDTLTKHNYLENFTVVAPITPSNEYQCDAIYNTWRGFISWRTAAAYDATLAMTEALGENPIREDIVTNLDNISLDSYASGSLEFKNRERSSMPTLVIASTDSNIPKPIGATFGFKTLDKPVISCPSPTP